MAPRRKTALPKTRTPEEWAAFFDCIATRYPTAARNHALLYLTYVTGLRIGETSRPSRPRSEPRPARGARDAEAARPRGYCSPSHPPRKPARSSPRMMCGHRFIRSQTSPVR